MKLYLMKRMKSFGYAWNGICILWKNEPNVRIHVVAAAGVTILSFVLNISANEWMAVIVAMGFVLATEIINTSIEQLSDFVSPEKNDHIKKVKDLAAAGVLVSAITALTIGLIVFVPKLMAYLTESL